jgi:hypothetical protein
MRGGGLTSPVTAFRASDGALRRGRTRKRGRPQPTPAHSPARVPRDLPRLDRLSCWSVLSG